MTSNSLPEQMTAVILDSYNGADALRVVQRPVPRPGPKEVLIKIAAAAINPSDLMFIQGRYGFTRPTPTVPGFEGSGTVVGVGEGSGPMGRYLAGKRVACVTQQDGLWSEYTATTVNYALPLDNAVSLEQGAMAVVNPLTAVALIDLAKKADHQTVINTAAASALGLMMYRLGQQEGVEVVGIVRRPEQVVYLKQQGMTHVLDSSDPDFPRQLRDLCHQRHIHLAFDAVGGELPRQLLDAMPQHSRVTVYGGLAQQPVQVNVASLIFEDKQVDGFWLPPWLGQNNLLQNFLIWRRTQKLMLSALKTEVRSRYPLSQIHQAIRDYESQMTGGKVLLVPGMEGSHAVNGKR